MLNGNHTHTHFNFGFFVWGMGGPIIAPAPTPHGAAEDANQHLPGGAGPPPRDLPTLSGSGTSTELGGVTGERRGRSDAPVE